MGGACGRAGQKYESKVVTGEKICKNEPLRTLLNQWYLDGVLLTGAMLVSHGEDEVKQTYNPDTEEWKTIHNIKGDAGLILKTQVNGKLFLELSKDGNLIFELSDSFRFEQVAQFKVSETRDFKPDGVPMKEVLNAIENQRKTFYTKDSAYGFNAFAKSMFKDLCNAADRRAARKKGDDIIAAQESLL
eukprot:gnl/MRDRNA2_/MRDRNA2_94296_c0_seq1.p1 gnl/MRDRNA2_/MRDRNA2_94296_c0~~gnl/MRDRNA2_/MRDRNA2_94296_c0_seq1.p1  ORF type:complete len:188 (+),score=39.29 gnl/MRDRNA2_/MRDRNA2_94296_c0_seq1:93-656(+)